jgi:hypothetical protein
VRVTGTGGLLLAGGRVAARLGSWRLERLDEVFHVGRLLLTARVLERDAFWAAHVDRFDLRLDAGSCAWLWRGVVVTWGDGIAVTVEGKPEVEV